MSTEILLTSLPILVKEVFLLLADQNIQNMNTLLELWTVKIFSIKFVINVHSNTWENNLTLQFSPHSSIILRLGVPEVGVYAVG